MDVIVIFTCFNRAEKTSNCIRSLMEGNPNIHFSFVVVNDGSSDDTEERLNYINKTYHNIHLINGDGSLFYSKGMREGMLWVNRSGKEANYVLLVNDDVLFSGYSIERLIAESKAKNNCILAGATCDDNGAFTYGGVRYIENSIDIEFVTNEMADEVCDTFNGNCVLIPWNIYKESTPMDGKYMHGAGDFDYGLSLKRQGAEIHTSSFFVGVCNRNNIEGTWLDNTLPRAKRIKLKESPKGLPLKSHLHFLRKNFGMKQMLLHGFTPYLKILFRI